MAHFVKNETLNGDICVHHYSGLDRATLISKVDMLFKQWGYKPIEGQSGNANYEKGNRTMRILFGAFIKYFKFTVSVSDEMDGVYKVGVNKYSSGMSGGLIGMNQVTNELKRIAEGLKEI